MASLPFVNEKETISKPNKEKPKMAVF